MGEPGAADHKVCLCQGVRILDRALAVRGRKGIRCSSSAMSSIHEHSCGERVCSVQVQQSVFLILLTYIEYASNVSRPISNGALEWTTSIINKKE